MGRFRDFPARSTVAIFSGTVPVARLAPLARSAPQFVLSAPHLRRLACALQPHLGVPRGPVGREASGEDRRRSSLANAILHYEDVVASEFIRALDLAPRTYQEKAEVRCEAIEGSRRGRNG